MNIVHVTGVTNSSCCCDLTETVPNFIPSTGHSGCGKSTLLNITAPNDSIVERYLTAVGLWEHRNKRPGQIPAGMQ